MIKVTEQDVATGSLTQETTYGYDLGDRLTLVNQGNQTRAFKYDAEGRLLFERIPEQTATINDGTGTYWSTKYTYTDWGAVATKQDARGVITTYVYDTLHRLVSISHNTLSGVTTAPTVTYSYDNVQTSNTKGMLLSMSVGSGYSESYSYSVGIGNGGNGGNKLSLASVTKTIDARNYVTSYQYNTANQPTQMSYPSGRVINFGHDNKGRLTSVGSFLTGVTYNGIGQLTGTSLGNGVSETYGYDANRMQLTSQKAGTASPYTNRMDLTYSYSASAGQSGVTSSAGNSHQLISLTGTINGTTESASYTYDLQKRLVTSNQTSNGSSAQRRFAYDRWGNRTGVWDAVTGGNQIQSVALQQSGGAPTNQIASVTVGSILNYTYDAAGNVTNDGVHSYGYDSENRVVSVDGGSTASYVYDDQNRRYRKTIGSTVTHYVWEGSQVLAEHNGSTGAVITDYVYSGRRMIAKVSGGATQYLLSDLWSTRLVLDTSGDVLGRQAHLPFGDEFAESGTQEKHHFTTYESESESGTDYAVNRQYSQGAGRFGSADPYQASSYLVNPQSWNRYSYVENDPIHNVDPLGLLVRYPEPGIDPCCIGNDCGDPGPPAPTPGTCSLFVNKSRGSSVQGYYPPAPRIPILNPNTQPIGPDVDSLTDRWFYFYEVIALLTGTFSFRVSAWQRVRGTFLEDRGNVGKFPGRIPRDAGDDTPFFVNIDRSRPGQLSWIDTPALPRTSSNGFPISDADVTWFLQFTVSTSFGPACFGSITLHLVVTNYVPTWTVE